MRNSLLTLLVLCYISAFGQSSKTQDTIDHPIFLNMLKDKSNNFFAIERAYRLYFSNKSRVKGTGWKQFERWAENAKHQTNPDGSFIPSDHIMKEFSRVKSRQLSTRSATGNWVNLGPFQNPTPSSQRRQLGRVNTIGFHPTNPNILYAGAPQGGFWVSNNKGGTWTSSTDNMPTLGISDMVILPGAPNPTILIGTGDRDANDANGLGVFRSTDNGVTFSASSIGMAANTTVNMFALNPVNNNTIIAATSSGIYISYNQGASWTKKSVANGEYMDVKYCPDDTTIVYAAFLNNSVFPAVGYFHRSVNGGNTWANVSTGFTSVEKRRLVIAVTPANPNIVYVLAAGSNHGLESFYKSSNKGLSFTAKISTTPNIMGWNTDGSGSGGQGFYDIAIEASKTDSNTVYTGGVICWKSTNGGGTWTSISDWTGQNRPFIHADIHYLKINPANNELYIGSDGGVDYTSNGGTSYTNINSQLAISQFYNVGVSQLSNSKTITGAQDNGTSVSTSASNWSAEIGGDGFACEISNFDINRMFGSLYYSEIQRTTNNGATWSTISSSITEANQTSAAFKTVFALHPTVNNILVALPRNIWISSNAVTAGSPSFTQLSAGKTGSNFGTAVRISSNNPDIAFVGWTDGSMGIINNLTTAPTYTAVTSPPNSGSNVINSIECSYSDENVVFAAKGNKVYRSGNKGTSWTDISGTSLPNIPIHSLILDKNSLEGLYAGTAAGVYYKDATMSSWILFNTGLPANSAIREMRIVYDTMRSSNSKIFAATYGRGLWQGDLRIDQTQPEANFTLPASSCAGIPVIITNTTTNTGTNTNYEWIITPSSGVTFVGGTSNTTANPQLSFATNGNYTITLIAKKTSGGFTRKTVTNAINIGTSGTIALLTTADTSICPGDTVTINTTGMQNYNIEPSALTSKINDSTFIVYPVSQTAYKVIGDINGSCKDTVDVLVRMKPFPNYNITGATKICAGDSTNIIITGVDNVIWTPTTNTFPTDGTNKTVKIIPTNTQQYQLRMTTAGLCDVKYILPITHQTIPTYNLNQPDSVKICAGDSLIFNESGVPSNIWFPAAGLNQTTGDIVIAKPLVNTKYYVRTSDTTICPNQYDSVYVTVLPIPNVSISGPNVVCSGNPILLTASGATSYIWSPPSQITGSFTSPSITASPSATTTYTVTGSNGVCSDTAMKTITVGANSMNISISGKTDICVNTVTTFTVSGATNYSWSPANVVNDFKASTVSVFVTDSMTLRVTGEENGCTDTDSIKIKLLPSPNLGLSLSPQAAVCAGEKVSLRANGASSYSVFPNFGTKKIDVSNFELKPMITTEYKVLGVNNFGCQAEEKITVNVNPLPVLSLNSQITTLNKGDSTTILADGADNYLWTPSTYVKGDTSLRFILVKPTDDIVYTVTGTTSSGCQAKMLAIINVVQNYSGLSIADNEKIIVYPNPADQELFVVSKQNFSITISDIQGRIIEETQNVQNGQTRISTNNLANGTYILLLDNKKGIKKNIKFTVQH